MAANDVPLILTSISQLVETTFDLGNGPLEATPSLHIGGSILDCWKWPTMPPQAQAGADAGAGEDGQPPAPPPVVLGAFITANTHRHQINTHAALLAERLTNEASFTLAGDALLHVAMATAITRVFAINLWNLQPNELELAQTYNVTYGIDPDGTITPAAGAAEETVEAVNGFRTRAADIDIERDEWVGLVRTCVCVPALNGLTLVTQGHHYLSNDRAAFTGLLNQTLRKRDFAVVGVSDEAMCDAVFHKALHPIKGPWLMGQAVSDDVSTRFTQMGISAAGVRLPALRPDLRAMSAYVELLRITANMSASYAINMGNAYHKLRYHFLAFQRLAIQMTRSGAPEHDMVELDRSIKTYMSQYKYGVAFMAAFLLTFYEAEATRGQMPSVLKAKSIDKLMNEAGYREGIAHYSEMAKYKRTLAREGKIDPVALFGAPAPHNVKLGAGQYGEADVPNDVMIADRLQAALTAAYAAVPPIPDAVEMPPNADGYVNVMPPGNA